MVENKKIVNISVSSGGVKNVRMTYYKSNVIYLLNISPIYIMDNYVIRFVIDYL